MDKDWWRGKVAYQVYPKSFKDSNNDGIGDLRGIIEKLDYIASLGIDILWLSPVYKSPFIDQGYDISDYYQIDPIFGDMNDMEELIYEGKKRGISIIMDLVINHCSSNHQWFKEALKFPNSEYSEYFYFVDSNDGPPNNWRSYFGGSAWEPVLGTKKYYLHSFHKSQPDLNWQNPKLRKEIYKMINWWLDKGIAGFRIDAIINIKKDLTWRSFPSSDKDGLVPIQESLKYAQSIEPFLRELSQNTFKRYNAFTVGEVFDETDEELEIFIGSNGVFSSIFDFGQTLIGKSDKGWYDSFLPNAEELKMSIFNSHKKIDQIGCLSTIIENHDEPRGVSHYILKNELTEKSKKCLATIQILRKGIPFIYQGQEIGMENSFFSCIDDFNDVSTKNEYQKALGEGCIASKALEVVNLYSRDNARTPMQWTSEEYVGFSVEHPWLMSESCNRSINVFDQERDKKSILNYYRKLISLYKDSVYGETIRNGELIPEFKDISNVISFKRIYDKEVLILVNFQKDPVTISLPFKIKNIILNNYDELKQFGNCVSLEEYQGIVVEI